MSCLDVGKLAMKQGFLGLRYAKFWVVLLESIRVLLGSTAILPRSTKRNKVSESKGFRYHVAVSLLLDFIYMGRRDSALDRLMKKDREL